MARKEAKTTPAGRKRLSFGEVPAALASAFTPGNLREGGNGTSHSRYDNPRGYVGLGGIQYGREGGYSDFLVTKGMQAETWVNQDHGTTRGHTAGRHDSEHSGGHALARKGKPL